MEQIGGYKCNMQHIYGRISFLNRFLKNIFCRNLAEITHLTRKSVHILKKTFIQQNVCINKKAHTKLYKSLFL